jgi:circadian clock protein KaiB
MIYKINKSSLFGISKNDTTIEIADLRLYIKGMYPDSVKAFIAAKAICEQYLPGRSSLEIVDTLKEPERALADGITNIPTLVKLSPYPIRSVNNEFEDPEHILGMLGLQSSV